MNFNEIKYSNIIGFKVFKLFHNIFRWLKYDRLSDIKFITNRFLISQGYSIDLANPKTLNEKINWLKLNFKHPLEHIFADKFAVREIVAKELGQEYLIPLVMYTTDVKVISPDRLPDYPFIIKANHDSGSYKIIRNKSEIDWRRLRIECLFWLSRNYYWIERERQYKDIKPAIIVEKLLTNSDGKIPYDYKLHCINGIVEFIYVSVDREGINKRNIYNKNWEPLFFTWAAKGKNIDNIRGPEIIKPSSFDTMIFFAEKLAKGFPYVRIDFYDVDGKIYFGELTQHHGGGFDQIRPIEWDYKLGSLVKIPVNINNNISD
jgi:hypothetical protein